jgi:hypothetical protein
LNLNSNNRLLPEVALANRIAEGVKKESTGVLWSTLDEGQASASFEECVQPA